MSDSAPFSLRLLSLYPKKLGSSAVGGLARARLPEHLREQLLGKFAARYGANVAEAEKPLTEYESFLAFFTRRLKPGLRPQAPEVPLGINSPVDGRLFAHGPIEQGSVLQAKGMPYTIAELLRGDPLASRFTGGRFATLYLAPKDYHRIHVPLPGHVISVGRIEGELWPVNDASTAFTRGLYVRNRRAYWIAEGTGSCAGLLVAAVLVGATHVGGCVIDDRWLSGQSLRKTSRLDVPRLPCAPGDDLGVFELGSTVVLLVGGPRSAEWKLTHPEGDLRVGERLGSAI